MMDKLCYILFIWGDIEPEVIGPFGSQEIRDSAALGLRKTNGDGHGIFPLDIKAYNANNLQLSVGAYSGAFFEEE